MGVSLYTQEQRKAFASEAEKLLTQSRKTWGESAGLLTEQAKAYIALAQL